jgi:hypothetical protein
VHLSFQVTREVEIRRISVPGQSGQKERPYLKNNQSKKDWRCTCLANVNPEFKPQYSQKKKERKG